jgi:hypothetical protein
MATGPGNIELLVQLATVLGSLGATGIILVLAWKSPEILKVFLAFVRSLINDYYKRKKA